MNEKHGYNEMPTTQVTLPLSYTLLSSGILELSDTDRTKTGRLYHIRVNDEWRDYYALYIGKLDDSRMPDLEKLDNNKEIIFRRSQKRSFSKATVPQPLKIIIFHHILL